MQIATCKIGAKFSSSSVASCKNNEIELRFPLTSRMGYKGAISVGPNRPFR